MLCGNVRRFIMYVWKKIQKTKSPANLRLQGFVAEKEGFEPSMCY